MKNDQEEAYEKILNADLQRAIEFLKFAEAKNAALLTLTSAWLLALIGIVSGDRPVLKGLGSAFAISIIFLGAAAISCCVSFFPKLHLPAFLKPPAEEPKTPSRKNLLFFGDIASLQTAEFEKWARQRYFPEPERNTTEDYLGDLGVQVAVISKITNRKMILFGRGLKFLMIAAAIVFLPLLGWAFKQLWNM